MVEKTMKGIKLLFQDVYDTEFIKSVYQSAVVSYQELKDDKVAYDGSVRIIYHTKEAYKRTSKMLGLMDDFKASCYFLRLFVSKCLFFLLIEWSTKNRIPRNRNFLL